MAIPPPPGPPPPPCPPPPPAMGGLKLGAAPSGGGDMRSALLQSIQKGKALKKTVTVDKSGPAISGKIQGEVTTNTSPKRSPQPNITSNNIPNGGPKLGGIFEGLSSMPKLKPINGTRAPPSSSIRTNKNTVSSSVAQQDTNTSPPSAANTNGPMDFNTELTKHLTLKRQKQQINATEANLRTNRGPPPQPPTQKNLSSSTSDSVIEKSNTSVRAVVNAVNTAPRQPSSPTLSEGSKSNNSIVKKNISNLNLSIGNSSNSINSNNSSPTPPSTTVSSSARQSSQILPNKSTLFGNSSINSSNTAQQPSPLIAGNQNKPAVNHGKPNFAPKPPAIQQIIANGQRNAVSRHHSMKSPRSPPITAADGSLVYPAQAFNTLRGPPQSFQSTEAINRHIVNAPIGRPTVAPPKPPAVKPPPPPTPARSVSNTNLTFMPLSIAPTNAQSNTTTTNTTSSFNNVSTIRDQLKLSNVGSTSNLSTVPTTVNSNSTNKQSSPVNNREKSTTPNFSSVPVPPLPPHRTCPAPPPPQRQLSNSNIAPVPPQRHSSMRSGPGSAANNNPTQNIGNTSVGRLITNLEMKFGDRFHNVTEFPAPPPFLNIQKTFPSRNNFTKSSNVSENRKARAPEPPGKKPTEQQGFVQLTESKLVATDGLV